MGKYPCTWDLFAQWGAAAAPKPARVQIFTRHCVVIADPSTIKRVMSTNLKNYSKDLEFAYAPFLDILGGDRMHACPHFSFAPSARSHFTVLTLTLCTVEVAAPWVPYSLTDHHRGGRRGLHARHGTARVESSASWGG